MISDPYAVKEDVVVAAAPVKKHAAQADHSEGGH
jgi:hypothetical protein